MPPRQPLIVISPVLHPSVGSEPGIGYQWCRILVRHFNVHLVSGHVSATFMRDDPLLSQLTLHQTPREPPNVPSGWRFYVRYRAWCATLPAFLLPLVHHVRPVGVHHLNVGSFRILPRYDRLGVPYTLGPIGGGEFAPGSICRHADLPRLVAFGEALRRPFNQLFTLRPALRAVASGARRVLATSPESAAVLQAMGARDVRVLWPVAVAERETARAAAAARAAQAPSLRGGLRAVFVARGEWWKGGTLAAQLVVRLRRAGVPVTLDVYSSGAMVSRMQRIVSAAGFSDALRLHGFCTQPDVLRALAAAHVFVLPSFHDSSGFALPEAYQHGLPAFTLGLGGHRTIGCPAAGVCDASGGLEAWYAGCVLTAQRWLAEPATWVASAAAARRHYEQVLGEPTLDRVVEAELVSAYRDV